MANSSTNIDTISTSQSAKEITANAFFDATSQSATYGRRASTSSGLTWGYYGGNVIKTDGTLAQISNGTLTLTASSTNYIVALKSTGAVSFSTATTNWNDTANYWRLYQVVTGSSTVSSYTDNRAHALFQGGAPNIVNPMTNAGDIIIGGSSGAPTRLAIGSSTQVLTVSGGFPAWAAPTVTQLDYGQRAVSVNSTAISVTAASDSTLATNTDYIQITGIFNATPDGINSGITQQTNSFTIAQAGAYRIEFWANAKSSVNNTQIAFKFAVNGVIGLTRRPKIFMRNSNEVHNGGAFEYTHFDAGDVVTLWIASTVTADITIEDLVFGATAIKYD